MSDTFTQANNYGANSLSIVGTLAALMGHIVVVTVGVDSSCTVAIQCIEGRNVEKYMVFNGPMELKNRYDGMRKAFGERREIFVPEWIGGTLHSSPLATVDYDNLVMAVDRKRQLPLANPWLSVHTPFPIINWGSREYGNPITIAYAVSALLPIFVAAFGRWWTSGSWIPEVWCGLVFALTSAFGGMLLDVRREVCYIRVKEAGVSVALSGRWVHLYNRALDWAPTSAIEAVRDVANGQVRKHGVELLIPVIAVKPTVEFRYASWLFIFTYLRTPLLTAAYYFTKGPNSDWGATYCIAAIFQACLQRAVSDAHLTQATTHDVFWFRRLPSHPYPEELAHYRKVLD